MARARRLSCGPANSREARSIDVYGRDAYQGPVMVVRAIERVDVGPQVQGAVHPHTHPDEFPQCPAFRAHPVVILPVAEPLVAAVLKQRPVRVFLEHVAQSIGNRWNRPRLPSVGDEFGHASSRYEESPRPESAGGSKIGREVINLTAEASISTL